MNGTRWIEVGLLAGALCWGAVARAADEHEGGAARASRRGAGADREFLEQALGVNELELRLGRLAAERASSPELRGAARKMVEKHTALGQELSELARRAGGEGEARMTAEQRDTLAGLEREPQGTFDGAFTRTVDAGHVKELAMYRAEVDRAGDPRLRDLAGQRVQALQQAVAGTAPPTGPASAGGGTGAKY